MRSIFIILVLVGLVKGLTGADIGNANSTASLMETNDGIEVMNPEPHFTELKGNLFLAVQTPQKLNLEEGAIVEFQFKRNGSVKSFHVNDVNQDVLNQGDADLLVMVHDDLAQALRSHKLMKMKITSGSEVTVVPVNDFWPPHDYLATL